MANAGFYFLLFTCTAFISWQHSIIYTVYIFHAIILLSNPVLSFDNFMYVYFKNNLCYLHDAWVPWKHLDVSIIMCMWVKHLFCIFQVINHSQSLFLERALSTYVFVVVSCNASSYYGTQHFAHCWLVGMCSRPPLTAWCNQKCRKRERKTQCSDIALCLHSWSRTISLLTLKTQCSQGMFCGTL